MLYKHVFTEQINDSMTERLIATHLSKSHPTPDGKLTLFQQLNIHVRAGESVALMGESGCGKSTLLHILAGLESADTGDVFIQKQNLSQMSDRQRAALRRTEIGIVFQQLNLIPSLCVYDNLAFQARLADRYDSEWLLYLIHALNLADLLNRLPAQLSGGQQQRVAIGRALAARTPLLFADEPTGSLDEAHAEQVMSLLLNLVKETHTSLLMVTHSSLLADQLDRVLRLKNGQLSE